MTTRHNSKAAYLLAAGLALALWGGTAFAAATYTIKVKDTIAGLPLVGDGQITFTKTGAGDFTPDSYSGITVDFNKITASNGKVGVCTFNAVSPTDPLMVAVQTSVDTTPESPVSVWDPVKQKQVYVDDSTSPQGPNVEGLRGSVTATTGGLCKKNLILTFSLDSTTPHIYQHRVWKVYIVGNTTPSMSGYYHIQNLATIPEPGTIALLLGGLGALLGARRFRSADRHNSADRE